MTMHPPPDPDELASDLVDGLLPPDEAARLRADPDIAARVEAIEAVRAALRVPPPSPPGAIDRSVGAALASLESLPSPGAPSGDRPPLAAVPPTPAMGFPSGPQAPARSVRRGSTSNKPWLAAAAAIVLVGLITIGALSQKGSDSDSSGDSAAVASDAAPEESAGGDIATDDDAASGEMPSESPATTSPAPGEGEVGGGGGGAETTLGGPSPVVPGDLGSFDTVAELADQVASAARQQTSAHESTPDAGVDTDETDSAFDDETCSGLSQAGDASRGRSVYVADAVFQGDRVRVHLYESADGSQRLVATDLSCTDVVDTAFAP